MEFLKLYDEENRDILFSMSWLNKNSIFDKSIGSFEDIDLFTFLENINSFDYVKDIFYDDVYYILEYTKDSILHLINNINREVKREHKIVPISQAKEFDKKTILWLSRQDGRTIKEKLKTNKIKAVKRYHNVDTYENRIFKIFLKKLVLVEEKREQIQSNDYLIGKIRQWLRSDDAKSINEYGNIVYNNILLHHPHYSKIFKSYKWLNRLDEKIEFYLNTYQEQLRRIIKFEVLEQLQFQTNIPMLPKTLEIKRDKFSLKVANPLINIDLENMLINTYKKFDENNYDTKAIKDFVHKELKSVICDNRMFTLNTNAQDIYIDLFRLFPIAKIDMQIINFPITLLQNIEGTIVNANNTKVIDLNHEIYTLPEILKSYDTNALRVFLENFEKYFKDKQLNYIIPDYVNIFEFSSVKKTINSYFPHSRNIPKSILAGLQYLFDGKAQKDDTLIYIQKNHDNDLYITPLLVKYDKSLQSVTNWLYLEKHPTKKLQEENDIIGELNRSFDDSKLSKKLLNKFLQNGIKGIKKEQIAFYNDNNLVYLKNNKDISKPKNRTSEIKSLFNNKKLFKKEYIEINDNNENNLNNFEKLLQYEQDDYILWKEHLPKLTMGNILVPQGYYDEFVLVDDNSEVLNGYIAIKEHFQLPANLSEISFPLILDDEDTGYEAYISSNDFPLQNSVVCELELTYNYENVTPYKLTFRPLNNSVKSLKVIWKQRKAKEYRTLPIPDYPPRKNWNDFRRDPKPNGNGYSDLLDWILERLEPLNDIYGVPKFILEKEIEKNEGYFKWGKYDKNGKYFCFITVDGEDIFCHSSEFKEEIDINTFYEGMIVSLNIKQQSDGRKVGKNITFTNISKEEIIENVRKEYLKRPLKLRLQSIIKGLKSIKPPLLKVWNEHALTDMDAPENFRKLMHTYINLSTTHMRDENLPIEFKQELFHFLCHLHQDMPIKIANTLVKYSSDNKQIKAYAENIALALGSLQLEWQKQIFNNLLHLLQNDVSIKSVLHIFSIASWRSEKFINEFNYENLKLVNNYLLRELNISFEAYKTNKAFHNFLTLIRELELLFSMLRTRKRFSNFLNPNQEDTKKYIKFIDNLTKYCILNHLKIKTRINIEVRKTLDFQNTPDILYALRVYLSGDTSSANAIQILGVSDD